MEEPQPTATHGPQTDQVTSVAEAIYGYPGIGGGYGHPAMPAANPGLPPISKSPGLVEFLDGLTAPAKKQDAELARTPARVINAQVDLERVEASTPLKPSEDVKVDLLEEGEEESPFEEAAVQRSFKSKVFGILCGQLAVAMSIMAPFMFVDTVAGFVRENSGPLIAACVTAAVLYLVLLVCVLIHPGTELLTSPTNYIFLVLWTLCQGFMLGTASAHLQMDHILVGAGICAIICLGLALLSTLKTLNMNGKGGCLFACIVTLGIIAITTQFFVDDLVKVVWTSLGALLFCIHLVDNVQTMAKGEHKYVVSPEEHIVAVLNVYVGVVNTIVAICISILTLRVWIKRFIVRHSNCCF